MTSCYSPRLGSFSDLLRTFFVQQTVINTETHHWTESTGQVTTQYSALSKTSISHLPPHKVYLQKRGLKEQR